jgi:hypothetical protein
VQTIAPVAQLRWRPGHPTQIASTALSIDYRIQIFDLCSPFVPILTVGEAEDAVTGLAWQTSGTLVSCSKDARLRVSSLSESGRAPHHILNPCTSAWSPDGELAFALGREERDDSLPRPGRRSQLSLLTGRDEKVCPFSLLLLSKMSYASRQRSPSPSFSNHRLSPRLTPRPLTPRPL